MQRTPAFWFDKDALAAKALAPAAYLYKAAAYMHSKTAKDAYKSSLPVICVGNVISGGAGKTPAVQALANLLKENDLCVNSAVLLRGYGGKLKGPTLVASQFHSAQEVGDEALLHAQYAQTIVSRKRDLGARLAEAGGNDIILMDDGLQNYQLQKDISFLVFDTAQGLGNGHLIPAGPLREPVETALAKTDALIVLGDTPLPFETDKPVFKASIKPEENISLNNPVIAFAGIGQPQKFFDTLQTCGAEIVQTHIFADHHPYREKDILPLLDKAEEMKAELITTEKDYVRLPLTLKDRVKTLPVHMVFDNTPALLDFLKARLHS